MKLRTQFVILVAGIIAVPFLVTAFMLLVRYTAARGREPVPNYAEVMSWVGLKVPRAVHRHDLAALQENRPPGLDIVVLDGSDVISSSTIPELAVGTPASMALLLQYVRNH